MAQVMTSDAPSPPAPLPEGEGSGLPLLVLEGARGGVRTLCPWRVRAYLWPSPAFTARTLSALPENVRKAGAGAALVEQQEPSLEEQTPVSGSVS
jgi:hypothetical protein